MSAYFHSRCLFNFRVIRAGSRSAVLDRVCSNPKLGVKGSVLRLCGSTRLPSRGRATSLLTWDPCGSSAALSSSGLVASLEAAGRWGDRMGLSPPAAVLPMLPSAFQLVPASLLLMWGTWGTW